MFDQTGMINFINRPNRILAKFFSFLKKKDKRTNLESKINTIESSNLHFACLLLLLGTRKARHLHVTFHLCVTRL